LPNCRYFSLRGGQIALQPPGTEEMHAYLKCGSRLLARGIAFLLVIQLAAAPINAQTLPTALHLVTVRGEGATGRVQQRASQEPAVCVVDENEKPVSGVAVAFTLPTEGATGSFGNGSKTLTLITDSSGLASAQGLRFNQIPGKVPVHVNASYKGLTARTTITQVSEAPAGYKPGGGGGSGKVIAILAVIAAAGGGGAYYALSQNKSVPPSANPSAPPSAIGITPGTGTIAPPR
jgi:hypothetical protein